MATLQITLPDPVRDFAEEQARKEGFGSVGDYLGSLVREAQRRLVTRALEAKLKAGMETPLRPVTAEDWESIRRTIRERSPEVLDRGVGADPS